ncbi:MAG: RpiB/LacA/LacB family sugar-phosphate isomerase, partial [Negativicutes bacterium]|nr:RpiB/LacA/LacB family sugar-phosphate isomerase [Negativicutes bacterium]
MKVAIGSDHGGFRLKEEIKALLTAKNIPFQDFGTCSTESVDYPDISRNVAEVVASGEYDRGIIICGRGIGVSIAANKVKGIRAALC